MSDMVHEKVSFKFKEMLEGRKDLGWSSQSKRANRTSTKRRASDFVPGLYEAEGNAYFLVGIARRLCRQHKMNEALVVEEMNSGDKSTMIEVFDKYFTGLVSEYSFPRNKL